jgi:hypothetical protein
MPSGPPAVASSVVRAFALLTHALQPVRGLRSHLRHPHVRRKGLWFGDIRQDGRLTWAGESVPDRPNPLTVKRFSASINCDSQHIRHMGPRILVSLGNVVAREVIAGKCFDEDSCSQIIEGELNKASGAFGGFVPTKIIEEVVYMDEQGKAFAESAASKCPDKDARAHIGNMIGWFSRRYTDSEKLTQATLAGNRIIVLTATGATGLKIRGPRRGPTSQSSDVKVRYDRNPEFGRAGKTAIR